MTFQSLRAFPLVGLASLLVAAAASADDPKPYREARASLSIAGVPAGVVADVDFQDAASDVIVEKVPAGQLFPMKHISNVKYGDISIVIGADASSVIKWISDSWAQTVARKNGTLLAGGTSREFFNGLLTEVSFPVLDTASQAKFGIGVKITPEYTRRVATAGEPAAAPQLYSANTFKVTVAGLDASKVFRVDPFTVKQTVREDAVGEMRDYQKEPAALEFPNLTLYVRPADAAPFVQWHDDFVIKGHCTQDKEKLGSIELLGGDGKPLLRVGLSNVGIRGLHDVSVSGSRAIAVELYVERMDLSTPKVVGTPLGPLKVNPRQPVNVKPASGARLL